MLATSASAEAARAAVAAAAALGVTGVEPAILADGSNVIVHLAPSPLVAKVPGSSTAVRPGIDGWLGRELDLACFLRCSATCTARSGRTRPRSCRRCRRGRSATTGSAPVRALQGDAGAGNLMATGGQLVWHDFEEAWSGPAAWDLAATTASPRFDRARILAAYADAETEPAGLRACEQLRRLHLTIWYALYAERLPDCRQRANELLASWRTPSRPPRPA